MSRSQAGLGASRPSGPQGSLIARFPLAEHHEDKTTTWHTIVAFNERAQKLQEAGLSHGQEVTIVGYPHAREVPIREGKTKTVQEIYAVVVKATKQPGPSS